MLLSKGCFRHEQVSSVALGMEEDYSSIKVSLDVCQIRSSRRIDTHAIPLPALSDLVSK